MATSPVLMPSRHSGGAGTAVTRAVGAAVAAGVAIDAPTAIADGTDVGSTTGVALGWTEQPVTSDATTTVSKATSRS